MTLASIAYVATQVGSYNLHNARSLTLSVNQVRFSLSSSPVFSRTDTVTDSERFYNSVIGLFDDPEELEEVNELLAWWNRYVLYFCSIMLGQYANKTCRQIFPSQTAKQPVCKNSALAKIKEKRAERRALENLSQN